MGTAIDWSEIKRIDALGIDEITTKKGHKDFVLIVTAFIEGQIRLLAVLKNREKATVKEFFMSIPKRLRKNIRAICSDLYAGFIGAAKEVFGKKIPVIADRFSAQLRSILPARNDRNLLILALIVTPAT